MTKGCSVAKIAISLPEELLDDVDRLAGRQDVSRSEVFRRAADLLLENEAEQEIVRAYVAGYRAMPESDAEVTAARRSASAALAAEPWE